MILPAKDLHDPKDFRVALKESFRHLDPGGGEDTVDPCDLFDDVDFVQGGYGDDEAGEGDFDESLLDLNDLSILSDEIVSNMLVPELKVAHGTYEGRMLAVPFLRAPLKSGCIA